MSTTTSTPPSTVDWRSPLPGRQFHRFILVFHVVFLCGLVFTLGQRWGRVGQVWQWRELVLGGAVGCQMALYVYMFQAVTRRSISLGRWGAYFIACLPLWLLTWRMEPAFEWVIWAYLGQLFGIMPPRISLPSALGALAVYGLAKFSPARLAAWGAWEWAGALFLVFSWTTLGLFLHKLTTTSSERARLIEALTQARRELELGRQRETELAALRERERIARDLHDNLGHALVTLTVQMEAVQRLLAVEPAKAMAALEQMKQLTRDSMITYSRAFARGRWATC